MEITYLGHSCFKVKNKAGLVIYLDPFKSDMVGLPLPKDVADVVTVSHAHDDHRAVEVITGPINREKTFVIDKVGEYEIAGVQISAMSSFHDKNGGAERGKNLVISMVVDGLVVVHLGDLGAKLSESQIDKLGSVAVLMVPVGGTYTLDAGEALALTDEIQPAFVIPMHYQTKESKIEDLAQLDVFLEKNKYPLAGESVHKIKVETGSLPEDTQVLLMNG